MSDSTQIQRKIVELANKRGIDPSKLTDKEYRMLSLEAHNSISLKVEAARKAVTSRIKTDVLGVTVPLTVSEKNMNICKNCPDNQFMYLSDGAPACKACGCSGKFLISKTKDPIQKCPKGYWDNNAI